MSQVKVTTDPNENKKQTKIMNKVDVQLNHKKEDGVSLPMIQFFTIDQNTIFKRLFSLNKKPYSRTFPLTRLCPNCVLSLPRFLVILWFAYACIFTLHKAMFWESFLSLTRFLIILWMCTFMYVSPLLLVGYVQMYVFSYDLFISL